MSNTKTGRAGPINYCHALNSVKLFERARRVPVSIVWLVFDSKVLFVPSLCFVQNSKSSQNQKDIRITSSSCLLEPNCKSNRGTAKLFGVDRNTVNRAVNRLIETGSKRTSVDLDGREPQQTLPTGESYSTKLKQELFLLFQKNFSSLKSSSGFLT